MAQTYRRALAAGTYTLVASGLLMASPEVAAAEECYPTWVACLEALATPGEHMTCKKPEFAYCATGGSCGSSYRIVCDEET